tara:strand:+ start:146 stop:781 length:636 start_codon:yes stop_codon:yes gene_type:complete
MGLDAEWYFTQYNKNSGTTPTCLENISILRKKVMHCKICNLSSMRNNSVFGEGNLETDIMIIGEAPGREEDELGTPFVGRAGRLLDEILFYLRLDRNKIFITNTVKCRPPENRNPSNEEISACKGYLRDQINHIKPKLLILLGKVAANSILHKDMSMSDMRRKIFDKNEFNLPIFVLYHPAFILRSPLQKKSLWEDIKFLENYIENGYSTS